MEDTTVKSVGILVVLCAAILPVMLCAQDDTESDKINSNLGVSLSLPQSQTSQLWSTGWGTSVGVGYNFNQRHSAIGEFNWNRLYENHSTLANPVNGFNDVFSVTGNYRFEMRGNKLGTYFIGGAGWYYSAGAGSLGGNAGIGFTVKTAEPSYRLYLEARYHYAPTRQIATQWVNVTFGIRY
jgi:Outer membrane protein beta-barrel domain